MHSAKNSLVCIDMSILCSFLFCVVIAPGREATVDTAAHKTGVAYLSNFKPDLIQVLLRHMTMRLTWVSSHYPFEKGVLDKEFARLANTCRGLRDHVQAHRLRVEKNELPQVDRGLFYSACLSADQLVYYLPQNLEGARNFAINAWGLYLEEKKAAVEKIYSILHLADERLARGIRHLENTPLGSRNVDDPSSVKLYPARLDHLFASLQFDRIEFQPREIDALFARISDPGIRDAAKTVCENLLRMSEILLEAGPLGQDAVAGLVHRLLENPAVYHTELPLYNRGLLVDRRYPLRTLETLQMNVGMTADFIKQSYRDISKFQRHAFMIGQGLRFLKIAKRLYLQLVQCCAA